MSQKSFKNFSSFAKISVVKINCFRVFLNNPMNCKCDREDVGRKKIKDANEKRRAFYKTEKGLAVRKAYREKAAKKRQIINQLSQLKLKSKASLQLETIQNLIKLLD